MNTLLNQKFDVGDNALLTYCLIIATKILRLFGAVFGFMLLSFVNGLVVRVALMCSNVVLFPLLALMERFSQE